MLYRHRTVRDLYRVLYTCLSSVHKAIKPFVFNQYLGDLNMKVDDENQAYRIFVNGLMAHLGNEYWKQMSNHVDIYEGMTQSSKVIITIKGDKIDEYRELSNELLLLEHDASLFLRNHIFNLTGEKIWGLTFTLYPDGKFEIEYDYDKPKDYEETNDVITGDEINRTFESDSLKS